MKFLIPSSGRTDFIQNTVKLFGTKDVLVYVKEREYDNYRKVLPDKNLRSYSNKIIGMGAIRKHMLQDNLKEDYVFQVDDDVTEFEYEFTKKLSPERIVDPEHIKRIVYNAYCAANDIGTCLFGFISSGGPNLYTQLNHVLFSGAIFCGIGIIPRHLGSVMFDERMIVNEDHDFVLQTKYYKRFLFMDGRYSIRYRKVWTQEGGCPTIRNSETLEKCRNLLKKKWGNAVVFNKRKPNQIYIHVPF